MRGESDRDCRARGGGVKEQSKANVKREFHGKHAKNTPDATLKRGGGPLFRARGGSVARDELEERAYGGRTGSFATGGAVEAKAEGGAVAARPARKAGGSISGGAKAPHMGRAGRKRGGGVGSDLKPLTSAATPKKPPQRGQMSESEKTP
jgi:hypothetical protein